MAEPHMIVTISCIDVVSGRNTTLSVSCNDPDPGKVNAMRRAFMAAVDVYLRQLKTSAFSWNNGSGEITTIEPQDWSIKPEDEVNK